jgi:hypothetical protein
MSGFGENAREKMTDRVAAIMTVLFIFCFICKRNPANVMPIVCIRSHKIIKALIDR